MVPMRFIGVALVSACILLVLAWAPNDERLAQHRNLGKAFYENPTMQNEAVEEFRKALDLAPDSARDRVNYGLALLRAGKTTEGISQLQKAQEQDPKIPHTWFNLGIQYRREGEIEMATAQIQQMLKLVPEDPIAHYTLGALYRLAGEEQKAIAEFESAARLDPNLAAPHYQLFTLHRRAERDQEAARERKLFEEARKRQEGLPIPENVEWSIYSEVYEEIEPRRTVPPPRRVLREDVVATGMDPTTAGVLFTDLDADGKPDLIAWSSEGVLAGGKRLDLPGAVSVAAGDIDNDGKPELCLLTQDAVLLSRGLGKLEPLAQGSFRKAVFLDYDHDYDLDLFLLGDKSVLLRNRGAAGWDDRTADFPFVSGSALDATPFELVADTNGFDLVVSYADRSAVLYRDRLGGKYEVQPVDSLAAGDRVLRAAGERAEALTRADIDGDGNVEAAFVSAAGELKIRRFEAAAKNRWIAVRLTGVKNLVMAEGAKVELRAGSYYEKQYYHGVPLVFDLGDRAQADSVRITWPNGLIQNEARQAGGRLINYKELPRLSGSCPMIFCWNGREFEFITDVLGVAPLGATLGGGKYFPVDHDETVQIPATSLVPLNGRYLVRVTEELREVTYLDQVRLVAVDHPSTTEIFTNDKFKSPPFPEFRLFGVNRPVAPLKASDENGRNVLGKVLYRDRAYADTFERNYSGVAKLHSLTLDFGQAASENRAVLILNGWVDWADGSTFLGASQESPDGLIFPYLQVKDTAGNWRTVVEDMGIPAGKPKTIAVDLTGKFLSASREIRVITNLCVYWDRIFLSESTGAPEVRLTDLSPAGARLRFRGWSKPLIDPERRQPESFDYATVLPASMWNPTPGYYTRYGDVRPLIEDIDDRLVVMGSGDELELEFDARALPPLPNGWRRDYLLSVDGWAKDGDANTAYSQTVEPLPKKCVCPLFRPALRILR